MSVTIIITLCILLLLAYVFDLTSSKTKIPSVILLLISGWVVRQAAAFFRVNVPFMEPILPILGTVGLILIVLEGSLELELNRSKLPVIIKSLFIALLPMLLMSFGLAFAFQHFSGVSLKSGLANAIPFAVISSAIAIPSARHLMAKDREFITYESSLSDIFGVILFNFITLNNSFGLESVGHFGVEMLVILTVSFIATLALAYFLHEIKHHIKFAPIILMIVLIYLVSKNYHLPALIFILLFGLFLGNIDELSHYPFMRRFHPENFQKEVHKFKELTSEFAFLVRALFFLLFGYLFETAEIINVDTVGWAIGITISIFVLRAISLKSFGLLHGALVYLAPRGLITILLFLSIPEGQVIALANKSLVIQVIILTALVMMLGLMSQKKMQPEDAICE